MNINNIYIASIRILVDSRLIGDIWTGEIKMEYQYVKTTAIYVKNNKWYDLETKKEYNKAVYGLEDIGTQFIDFKRVLIPLSDVIDYQRQNMMRKKILKKYKELENGGRKE